MLRYFNEFSAYCNIKRFHVAWLITWASAGILAGIALVRFISYEPFIDTAWLVVALTFFILACRKRSVVSIMFTFFAGILLGLYTGSLTLQSFAQYEPYYNDNHIISGTVRDDITEDNTGAQRMRITDVTISSQPLDGYIWISTNDSIELRRGDKIVAKGKVLEGFGIVQASMFRAEIINAERPHPGDVALAARTSFTNKINEFMAEPQASLGVSFLAGQRTALPEATQAIFRDLGLVHLVVASGFHLTIVIRFSRRLCATQSKYLATALSFGMIGGFLLLTGFSTSMVRASIVAGLSLLAWYVGRSVHPVVLLLFVAATTALINPAFVWHDLAWHLSFAAFTGVIILAPLLHSFFWNPNKEPGFLRYIVIATLSAQLLTFPIIALTFEQYSPLALLSNLMILPLVPLVMLGTFLVGIIGYMLPWLAAIISWPTQIGLGYITSLTNFLASTPWAVGAITIEPYGIILSYLFLLLLMIYLQKKTGHPLRQENPID